MTHDLPRGITGFYSAYRGAPPPKTDVTTFKTACYAALREVRGHVLSVHPAHEQGDVANYHAARVTYHQENLYILCNAHYPYIALTREIRFEATQYIDIPELQQAFKKTAIYIPLASTFLHQYPEPHLFAELEEAEKKQIQLWKPRQVGDIIFNQWD